MKIKITRLRVLSGSRWAILVVACSSSFHVLERNSRVVSLVKAIDGRRVVPPRAQNCSEAYAASCDCPDESLCRLIGTIVFLDARVDPRPCLLRAISENADDFLSAFRLGQFYERCGDRDSAISAYRRVPGIERLKTARSAEFFRRNECQSATREIQDALELAPTSADAIYQLGMVLAYCDPRDYPSAIVAFRQAARLGYSDPYVWTRVAHAQAMENLPDAAVQTLVTHNQVNPLASAIRGDALQTLGRFREAVSALERAVAQDNGNPWFRVSLGYAYWRSGQPDRARRSWEQALVIQPEFGPAIKALADHR